PATGPGSSVAGALTIRSSRTRFAGRLNSSVRRQELTLRILIALVIGLLLSALFLGVSFATDGAGGAWHHLRDIFISPPLWLLQTGLPAVSKSLAIQPGGPYSGASFFMLFFVLFWWLVCSALVFAIRRQPPNKSFKPNPLRGSA
ncbi:hypothetical protein QFW80_00890, partial [Luteimonas sp. M1R5S18]